MDRNWLLRFREHLAEASGVVCLLTAALALAGRFLDLPRLVRVDPAFPPMVANVALTFAIDGLILILLARGWARTALPGAAWNVIAGMATLVQYALGVDFGFDQLLGSDTLSQSVHPGRMAPNTAVTFLLCGVALFFAGKAGPRIVTGVLGAVVCAIGAVSGLGYLFGYRTYAWGSWDSMAANTAFAFFVLGLGILPMAWPEEGRHPEASERWPAIAAGCAGLTVTMTCAYALQRELRADLDRLANLAIQLEWDSPTAALQASERSAGYVLTATVCIGILLSVLVALLVDLALASRRRAEAVQRANVKLGKEIGERRRIEQQLLSSEERFRGAFEQAPNGIYLTGIDGRVLQANHAFCRLVGRPERELLNQHWSALTHPEDVERSQANRDALLNGQPASRQFEQRYIAGDGRVVWVRLNISLLLTPEGAPCRFITHVEDATARREAEAQLRQREERFQIAFEYAPIGIALSTRNRKIVQVNATLCRMLGYTSAGLLAINWDEITHPDDYAAAPDAIAELERDRPECVEFEKRYLHKDGHPIWARVRLSLAPDVSDEWEFVAHIEDITERKRAEEALRANDERVRQLLDATAEAICGVDTEGRCTFANLSCLRMLGYRDSRALIGRDLHQMTRHSRSDGGLLPVEECRVCQSFLTGQGTHAEDELFVRSDGTRFPVEYWAHPIRSGGAIAGSVVAFLDITQRKAAETELIKAKEVAEAASRAKSRFLANMSHEIRTPLNGVIGMAHLLLESDLAAEQRRYAEVVRASAETLKSLLDHILDLSKIEAGKMTLEHLDFDLRDVLAGVVEMMGIQAHRKGLELTCLISPDTPSRLRGDPGRLRQVVTNLLANAIKFTERGDVCIRVRNLEETVSDAGLEFAISDTGIGIAKEKAGTLFSPFVQADESTTRKYGGTGLGLAISRQLIEMMGGRIGLESEEGKGATFRFTARFQKQPAALPTSGFVLPAGTKALVLETHPATREVLATLLTAWGVLARESANIDEAIRLLREAVQADATFAVVLAAGEEVACRIASDPVVEGTPVILLTHPGERGPDCCARASFMFPRVSKPILEAPLRDALSVALGHKAPAAGPISRGIGWEPSMAAPARILLAEDNEINREILLAMMSRRGLAADSAANGLEAIRAIRAGHYDLVLMDCEMPEMDGYEACRRIRGAEAGTPGRRIPIVAVTASAMPGDREKCVACGMDDYLAKPIEPEELWKILAKWLPRAASPRPAPEPAAAPAEASTAEVFDRAGLLKRLGGNRVLAERVLQAFLDDVPAQLAALQRHLAEGDAAGARRIAHTIKGAAANVSAAGLRAVAQEAEHAALAGQLAKLAEILPAVTAAADRLRAELSVTGRC